MAEPAEIARRAEQLLAPGSLAGRRVLVTAGGTREPLDAVRFLGNRSSGRMGVALAEEARRRGADVVLLAANLAVPAPHGVETIPTPTAESMLDAALALADVDIALLAAAVADYRPAAAIESKRPKSDETWTVELEPTVDIARRLGEEKRAGQLLVTFGADLGEAGLERKRAMLETKNADLVVFNDVSRADIAFDASDNEVVLVTRAGERTVPKAAKAAIAAAILDEVERSSPPPALSDQPVDDFPLRFLTWHRTCPKPPDSRAMPTPSSPIVGHFACTWHRTRPGRPVPKDMSEAYDLFQEGRERLRKGMSAQATVPLEKAKRLEPDKASIREALGIAYFRLRRWEEAEAEFRAVLELSPTDDYAHYALGRTLEKQGRQAEANGHYKLASSMNPAERQLREPHPRARVRAVVQRVSRARVSPGGEIGAGLVRAPRRGGRPTTGCADRLAGKVARLRIFEDEPASSTARSSTRAARRSSSRSSR